MKQRVLIVDDHATFRGLAARLLRERGLTVVGEAADARSALEQAARLRPDVVLLDVMLPDRSGIEVAGELAKGATPPLVVLTSSRARADFGATFPWPAGCHFIPKHELGASRAIALLRGP